MTPLSRRTFLAAALASGFLSTLPAPRSGASDARKRLVAGTRTLEVNGRAARVYSLIGPDGRLASGSARMSGSVSIWQIRAWCDQGSVERSDAGSRRLSRIYLSPV
jgi:hypothetical protein